MSAWHGYRNSRAAQVFKGPGHILQFGHLELHIFIAREVTWSWRLHHWPWQHAL